jgi:hypothetical protein
MEIFDFLGFGLHFAACSRENIQLVSFPNMA